MATRKYFITNIRVDNLVRHICINLSQLNAKFNYFNLDEIVKKDYARNVKFPTVLVLCYLVCHIENSQLSIFLFV